MTLDEIHLRLNDAANDCSHETRLEAVRALAAALDQLNLKEEDGGIVFRVRLLLQNIFEGEFETAKRVDDVARAGQESQLELWKGLRDDIAQKTSDVLAISVSDEATSVPDPTEYGDVDEAYEALVRVANNGTPEQRYQAVWQFSEFMRKNFFGAYDQKMAPHHNRFRLIGVALHTIFDQETKLMRRLVEDSNNAFGVNALVEWHTLAENIGAIRVPSKPERSEKGHITEILVDSTPFVHRLDALMSTTAPPTGATLARNTLVYDGNVPPPQADIILGAIVGNSTAGTLVSEESAVAQLTDPQFIVKDISVERAKSMYRQVKASFERYELSA